MSEKYTSIYSWFRYNQQEIRQDCGDNAFVVCTTDGIVFHNTNVEHCKRWVSESKLGPDEALILHANDNSYEQFLRLERDRLIRRPLHNRTNDLHKQIFQWIEDHQQFLSNRYPGDAYVVCDLTGVLYAHKQISFCWQWVQEHASYDRVVIRRVHRFEMLGHNHHIQFPTGYAFMGWTGT